MNPRSVNYWVVDMHRQHVSKLYTQNRWLIHAKYMQNIITYGIITVCSTLMYFSSAELLETTSSPGFWVHSPMDVKILLEAQMFACLEAGKKSIKIGS